MISSIQCWLSGVKGDTGNPGIRGPRGLVGKAYNYVCMCVCMHSSYQLMYNYILMQKYSCEWYTCK